MKQLMFRQLKYERVNKDTGKSKPDIDPLDTDCADEAGGTGDEAVVEESDLPVTQS